MGVCGEEGKREREKGGGMKGPPLWKGGGGGLARLWKGGGMEG